MGIPKCPRIRHTIHKSFVSLTKCAAAWWNLPPWVTFPKTENDGRGARGAQMGMAKGVLSCGWHLYLRGGCLAWDHICFEFTAVSCVVGLGRTGLA